MVLSSLATHGFSHWTGGTSSIHPGTDIWLQPAYRRQRLHPPLCSLGPHPCRCHPYHLKSCLLCPASLESSSARLHVPSGMQPWVHGKLPQGCGKLQRSAPGHRQPNSVSMLLTSAYSRMSVVSINQRGHTKDGRVLRALRGSKNRSKTVLGTVPRTTRNS